MSILNTILFEDLNDREQKELYKQNKASHIKHAGMGAAIGGGLGYFVGAGLGHLTKRQLGSDAKKILSRDFAKKGALIGAGLGLGSSISHNRGLKRGLKGDFVSSPEAKGTFLGAATGAGLGYAWGRKNSNSGKLAKIGAGMIAGDMIGSKMGRFYRKGNEKGVREYYKKRSSLQQN